MNETMEKLLAAARQGAAQAGDLAVNTAHGLKKKAGETLSAAKQRLRIAALEGEIEGTLAEIGELLYATHTGTPTDSEVLQEKLRKMTEKMQRILSPERIERFVEEQLGDREKIYASELPMETMDDFIRLIYVRLYGSRKKMRYRIEKAEGANKISGEFDFPDFAIIKR